LSCPFQKETEQLIEFRSSLQAEIREHKSVAERISALKKEVEELSHSKQSDDGLARIKAQIAQININRRQLLIRMRTILNDWYNQYFCIFVVFSSMKFRDFLRTQGSSVSVARRIGHRKYGIECAFGIIARISAPNQR
jgi:transcription elongation factor GreA-like protein